MYYTGWIGVSRRHSFLHFVFSQSLHTSPVWGDTLHGESMTIEIKCEHSTTIDPNELKPHPGNPNKHPKNQIRMLAKSIEAYGWRHPIVVSSRSGYIIAGHARREAALLLGCVAPIDEQQFDSDEAELAVLLADNIIPELATLDQELLNAGKELLLAAEIELETIGLKELVKDDDDDDPDDYMADFKIMVTCLDEDHQLSLIERFEAEGLNCKPLIL
jgi:hypothetical protein